MELSATMEVRHKSGLHARAATEFVRLAQKFHSDVSIGRPEAEEVDGKSIIGIMTLGVEMGDIIVIRVRGADAETAMTALKALVEANFNGV